MVNGQKNGVGVLMYDNGRTYEGEFENDRKHGRAFERFPNQSTYEGNYVNGKPEGIWCL